MPRQGVPEITKQAIKKARTAGESVSDIAARFNLTPRTIRRITNGVQPAAPKPSTKGSAEKFVQTAIASGAKVKVDGVDLSEIIRADIDSLTAAMNSDSTKPRSLEGVAAAKIKMIQCYLQLNPPTLADFVDQLIARPDFDPGEFVRLLKDRYDQAS